MVIWTIIATVATYVVVDIAKSIREEKDDTYEMDVKEALEPDPIQLAIQDQIDKVELAKKEEEIRLYREELAKQKAEEERIAKEKEEQRLAKIEADKKAEQDRLAKLTKQKQSKPRSAEVANAKPNRSGNGRLLGTFEATGYCSCRACNGSWTGSPTASGVMPRANRTVAVDPQIIPLGSTIYIDGLGVFVAEDTGSAIKNNIVDIYFNSHEDALRWGRKSVKIKILD